MQARTVAAAATTNLGRRFNGVFLTSGGVATEAPGRAEAATGPFPAAPKRHDRPYSSMIKNVPRSAEPTASVGGVIGERAMAGAKDSKIGLRHEQVISTFVMLSQS